MRTNFNFEEDLEVKSTEDKGTGEQFESIREKKKKKVDNENINYTSSKYNLNI